MKLVKILSFSLLFGGLLTNVNAQGYGVKAGINIANATTGNLEETKNNTGFYVGVFKQMTLLPKVLYLQPEIQYSREGFKTNNREYNIDYIQVPVVAKLYFLKLFSIEAGPQIGFKIKDDADNGAEVRDINSFNTSLAIGASLNLPLGFELTARYISSFNEIADNTNAKGRTLQLGGSFSF
jgi:hypothetical protein